MKKYNHPIDDFFRETLNDHQMAPSDAAKKAFLSDVMLTPPPEKKGRNGWILLSVLLALVGSGIIIWAITAAKTTSTPPRVSAPAVKTAHSALSQQTDPENKTRSDQKENKPNPGQATPSPAKKQGVMIQMPYKAHTQSSGKTIQDIKEETSVKESITAVGDERVITPANASLVSNPPVSNELADAGISDNLSPVNQETPVPDSLSKIKKQDSTVLPAPVIKTTSTDARNRNSRWNASLGVYYTPEWMFNTLEGSKFVNNFGIEGTFHFDEPIPNLTLSTSPGASPFKISLRPCTFLKRMYGTV
ncbi:MAG: hypothetical protein NTW16_12235 [Bacteroidetes bacterium]|nr:hypothetical protein [Bacteroidota bacterium]